MSETPGAGVLTEELLRDIRKGSREAEHALCARCLPLLRRWAHGRLPHAARDVSDTDDLVQVALMRALRHLEEFESSGSGSFLAYLRQILLNEVRVELRKHRRRGTAVDIDDVSLGDDGDSVIENLVGRERLSAYERALGSLERLQQEAVVMRLELGMSYIEMALETGTTPDAVRMTVSRALKRMARHLASDR
jgi:RNA polymerase sigma-70 factor, ECF subfamily